MIIKKNKEHQPIKCYFLFLSILVFAGAKHSSAQSIAFSELNYNSDSTTNSGSWIELYNYGTSIIDLSGWYLKDNNNANTFTIPAGTSLAAGARLVLVTDAAKFAAQYPNVLNYIGQIPFGFGNSGDEARLFDDIGTLKLFMEYTDTIPWPEAADGTGRTLELVDPNVIPNDPSNWFVGCMFGSPGAAFAACNDPLVFDEINYNSDTLLDAGDWVELYNRSSSGINLTGWSFKDSNDGNAYFFPNNTQIASGDRLVLVHDIAAFQSRHPDVTNYIGPLEFNLSNNGELMRIYNYLGKLTFSVVYDDDGDWPELADGDGYTLELLDDNGNMNSAANWFIGCPEGSPGYEYDPDCNVGIESTSQHPSEILTHFSNDHLTIEFKNVSPSAKYSVSVFNLISQTIYHRESNGQTMDINTRQFTPGIYVLDVRTVNARMSQKFFIH